MVFWWVRLVKLNYEDKREGSSHFVAYTHFVLAIQTLI